MFTYFKLFKNIKNRIVFDTIVFIILLCILLLLNKSDKINFPLAIVTLFTSYILIILMATKSPFYLSKAKQQELISYVSYISLVLLLPIKKIKIICFEFVSDILIILINLILLNCGMFTLKVLNLIYSYNFLLSFVYPFSFILTWYSLFTLLYSLTYFFKDIFSKPITEMLASTLITVTGFIPISLLYLSDHHKRIEKAIINLYNNPEISFIFLLCSVFLYTISFIVNITAIYRREI